jgi:hypothetical protein
MTGTYVTLKVSLYLIIIIPTIYGRLQLSFGIVSLGHAISGDPYLSFAVGRPSAVVLRIVVDGPISQVRYKVFVA